MKNLGNKQKWAIIAAIIALIGFGGVIATSDNYGAPIRWVFFVMIVIGILSAILLMVLGQREKRDEKGSNPYL